MILISTIREKETCWQESTWQGSVCHLEWVATKYLKEEAVMSNNQQENRDSDNRTRKIYPIIKLEIFFETSQKYNMDSFQLKQKWQKGREKEREKGSGVEEKNGREIHKIRKQCRDLLTKLVGVWIWGFVLHMVENM